MKVLIINTYGGSLILGTKARGKDEIIGSYEDSGFGQKIPMANFPELNYITKYEDWPVQNLSDTVVIAHPPCSAFSVQNSSWSARGVNSEAFACTKKVLGYTMKMDAKVIAIESVVGACGGAWDIHQQFADENGYWLYRILQNGIMFMPQWRDRFWTVFVRKGEAAPNMRWVLEPNWQRIHDVTDGFEDGPTIKGLDDQLQKFKEKIAPICNKEDMSYFFDEQDPPHPTIGVLRPFLDRKFPNSDPAEICYKWISTYSSGMMVYLDPEGFAGVLLGGTWWYMNGRNLSEKCYKRIMGFPHDYVFPDTTRGQMRMFLSKGVIPQVATWILDNIENHLNGYHDSATYEIDCKPGGLADFRIEKKDWWKWMDGEGGLPELRHFTDKPAIIIPNHDRVEDIMRRIS